MHCPCVEPTKESIKAWLDAYPERDRHWLADKCEVEKRTVDNWLSSPQNIPAKALRIIEGLMRSDLELDKAKQPAPPMVVVLEVPIPVFNSDNRAALDRGMLMTEWAVEVLKQAAARDAEARRDSFKVAEEEPQAKSNPGT